MRLTSGSKTIAVTALLVVVLASLAPLPLVHANAASVEDVTKLGKPVVVRLPVDGVAFSYVDETTGDVVLVYSSKNRVPVAGYVLPTRIDTVRVAYPLQGDLAASAFSSLPSASYIAFATSLGEIVVLQPSTQGLSYSYIQAKPETILRIRVSSTGSLLAYFFDSSLRVYRLDRGGWYEIGPIVGNMSLWSKEGISVYSAEMLASLRGDRVDYQDIVAVYESVEEYPSYLVLRVFRVNNTELVPVPNAQVFGYVENLRMYTPTVTTAGDGTATLPVPVPVYNITIYVTDVNGTCYGFDYTGLNITAKGTVYTLPEPVILRPENTTVCPTPMKTAQLTFYRIGDNGMGEIASLTESVGGRITINAFLKPEKPGLPWTYLVIASGDFPGISTKPSIVFHYFSSGFQLKAVSWLPVDATVTSVAYTRDGEYIALGFSDGLIMVFHYDPASGVYKALWSYRLPNTIASLAFSQQVGDNTGVRGLVAVDSRGAVQLIALNATTQLPLLRVRDVPAFQTGWGTTVSTSYDANILAVSGNGAVFLVYGLGDAATSSPVKPVDVWNYVLQRLVLRVTEKDGTPVDNAAVDIYIPGKTKPLFSLKTNTSGMAVVPYILPGDYIVKVNPTGKYWLEPLTQEIKVEPRSTNTTQYVDIALPYRKLVVQVKLTDSFTNTAPEEQLLLLVYKNITGAPRNITNITMPLPWLNVTEAVLIHNITVQPGTSTVNFTLVKGDYRVTIAPLNPVESIYRSVNFKIKIPGNETVNITIPRKPRPLKIVLVDAKTSKAIEEPVSITVSWGGFTLYNGRVDAGQSIVNIEVPVKGGVRVEVIPLPPGGELPLYEGVSRVIDNIPPEGATTIIVLKRRLIPVTITILDNDTNDVPLVPLKVVVDGSETIMLDQGENVLNLKLDKGVHRLDIIPLPAFGREKVPLYANKTVVLNVKSLVSETVYLQRIYGELIVTVVDSLTKGMPIDAIEVYVNRTLLGTVSKDTGNTIAKYLLKGSYELSAVSVKNIYQPFKETVKLENDTLEVKIELKRKLITVNLRVLDDTGAPVTGARVTATGIDVSFTAQATTVDGIAALTLPYGNYRVCVAAPGFTQYCKAVSPEAVNGQQIPVILQPLPQTLLQRYLPLIVAIAVIGGVMAVIYRQRERILRAIAPEEEIF